MTLDRYLFDPDSYDAIAAAGLDVPVVLAALHGHPRLRRHVGDVDLIVVGRTPDRRWISAALRETDQDDEYFVLTVRVLTAEEQLGLHQHFGGQIDE